MKVLEELCNIIAKNHLPFGLEKGHSETDSIQMEIDTGDAAPRKQPVRRMPFPAQSEIAPPSLKVSLVKSGSSCLKESWLPQILYR